MALTGKTKLAGVMGWPVGHSRSPRLHGHWLAHYKIDGAYVPLPVEPREISARRWAGWRRWALPAAMSRCRTRKRR